MSILSLRHSHATRTGTTKVKVYCSSSKHEVRTRHQHCDQCESQPRRSRAYHSRHTHAALTGTTKKGKAAKQSMELLARSPEATARERDLIRAVPELNMINAMVRMFEPERCVV